MRFVYLRATLFPVSTVLCESQLGHAHTHHVALGLIFIGPCYQLGPSSTDGNALCGYVTGEVFDPHLALLPQKKSPHPL